MPLLNTATVTPVELRAFISGYLAPFKVPRRITVVDRLPKGLTGKVQRKRLSEALRAGMAGDADG